MLQSYPVKLTKDENGTALAVCWKLLLALG